MPNMMSALCNQTPTRNNVLPPCKIHFMSLFPRSSTGPAVLSCFICSRVSPDAPAPRAAPSNRPRVCTAPDDRPCHYHCGRTQKNPPIMESTNMFLADVLQNPQCRPDGESLQCPPRAGGEKKKQSQKHLPRHLALAD